jgi:NAD-dependent DNA ligase
MIQELRNKIIEANEAYRLGKPIMSDAKYDLLIEELSILSPDDEILAKVGHTISDETRKALLPIEMASMDKLKTIEEVSDWCRLKGIRTSELAIITPKLDGLSLCVEEYTENVWTRGDGVYGQKSNEHYKLIENHKKATSFDYTYGEVIMSKKSFLDKYSEEFANPRNLVAGLLNSKDTKESLTDCNYIRYGGVGGDFATKQEVLDELNKFQTVKINYHICKISELTEELLIDLFHQWSVDYEIDGVIIEVNNLELQEELGRETSSNNPVWARAFKHESFTQAAETEVVGISWNISKQGYLKPTLHVRPIKLDGVTVSNVTGNNARFVKDTGLGVGAIVKIIRSGMVIPKIIDVIEPVDFEMPEIDGVEIGWNENEVELITLTETDDQKLKKIISFFEILEAKNVGEGVIVQLWEAGYTTIKDILELTTSDLEKIDRFGKRKASIVYNSIQSCIKNISLSKLQHATGIFSGLGSKKLVLLEHFTTRPTVEQVMNIEGFAEISAQNYVDGYDEFFDFIKDLPITIEEKVEVAPTSSDLEGTSFVFTGVRRKDLEEVIINKGGKIGSSVSKTTTHLVMKSKGSGSSKEVKAIELGVKILTVEELENLLK